jgi:hypothetical protein
MRRPVLRPSRHFIGAALAVVGLLMVACGIPTGGPTAIAKSDVPFHLLTPSTGATPSTTTPPAVGVPETIFLVAGQHLVGVSRDVAVPTTLPATLSEVIGALLEGPTAEESAFGLQSFLTGTKTQVSVTVAGPTATVNFSTNPVLPQVVGPDQTLAIAQVVFTATEQPPITGVSFEIAGKPTPVPTASGAQVPGPVGRASYAPQAPTA